MQITDKVFVVTGAGNGIGREVTLELLRRGGRVAGVDLRAGSLEETARLAGARDRFTAHPLDITDHDGVGALPEQVLAAHGQVDGLVNVAGIIQKFVTFKELDEKEMRRVMEVNFWGTVNTCHAFLPHLLARPAGSVVNVSSMGGFVPVPGQTLYGASKAAVKLLTEGLYAELRDTKVDVSVVFPGGVSTSITENSGVTAPGGAGAPPEQVATEAAAGSPTPGAGAAKPTDGKGKKQAEPQTITPQEAARIIVENAVEKGAYRVTAGKDSTTMDRISRLSPKRATDMIAKQMAALLG